MSAFPNLRGQFGLNQKRGVTPVFFDGPGTQMPHA